MAHSSDKSARDLAKHPWLASVRPVREGDVTALAVTLSAEGHDRVRDFGLDAFQETLSANPDPCEPLARRVELILAASVSGGGDIFEADNASPRLLSMLTGDGVYRLLLRINSELEWFRGHFPDAPLLPGVVQLHWAVHAARSLFGLETQPVTVNRLKFQGVIVPPRVVELELGPVSEGRIPFEYRSLGNTHSKGVLGFDETKPC